MQQFYFFIRISTLAETKLVIFEMKESSQSRHVWLRQFERNRAQWISKRSLKIVDLEGQLDEDSG